MKKQIYICTSTLLLLFTIGTYANLDPFAIPKYIIQCKISQIKKTKIIVVYAELEQENTINATIA